jgi:2-polyprenyl-6-methoxyphenol hydroxylase-like FAD-dependent oxidoreductase
MDDAINHVVILGGGSAGWLTAGVIAAEHGTGLQITLVESPDVPTIGVGEGTWPSMRETLRKMGVSENAFFTECDASFKQGSKFIGWCTGAPSDFYYHPFSLPQGFFDVDTVRHWQSRTPALSFAGAVCAQEQVCEHGLAPKQLSTPEYAAVVNYAYHLDAAKFGLFLRDHCTRKLGVTHIADHVSSVNTGDDGYVESLVTKNHGALKGDLFIDCSGAASVLLGQHLQQPFISRQPVLFNDRALAVQVPYADTNDAIASATLSTAQRAGWIWDIGLPTRRGVGYVYSSAHSSDEQAEVALRTYLAASMGQQGADRAEFRQLSFEPGHRATFWHKNCVAVGMSAGFIEPLEASALALVELSAAMIRDDLPVRRSLMEIAANRFNERFRYRWDRVIDFLKLHYVLSQRRDSDYWRDHSDPSSIPERLRELLCLWRYQSPSRRDFVQAEEIFTAASYQYVLYGMGFETVSRPVARRSEADEQAARTLEDSAGHARRLVEGLPSNRELLEGLSRHARD